MYLASMAVINGAKSVDEIVKTVKGGFFSVIRVSFARKIVGCEHRINAASCCL